MDRQAAAAITQHLLKHQQQQQQQHLQYSNVVRHQTIDGRTHPAAAPDDLLDDVEHHHQIDHMYHQHDVINEHIVGPGDDDDDDEEEDDEGDDEVVEEDVSGHHNVEEVENVPVTIIHQPSLAGPPPVQTNYYDVQPQQQQQKIFGRLSYKEDSLLISENIIEIGRNSSTSTVHFHVGKNSFVSRKHLQILHDTNNGEAYLICLSKNGVFVDDAFQRKSSEPLKLTSKTCTFRFPSTNIRILFESFLDGGGGLSTVPYDYQQAAATKASAAAITKYQAGAKSSAGADNRPPRTTTIINNKTATSIIKSVAENSASNVIYAPLKITIPESAAAIDKKSPFPSPTGTISAANSCPTSPRHNVYADYHHNRHPYSYNNNDIFQTPATATPAPTAAAAAAAATYNNEHDKPPYSYAQLIVQSISASLEKQLTLSGIYSFISKHYPYYRKEINKGWQNSIRHNLSLNRYFIKVARSQDEPGKGSFWRIDPNSESKLIDQSYKKRRQRGAQCFRTPYGMPRSAPVSPSHIDNSGDNSPLHDIVLQSAPVSPGALAAGDRSHSYHHYNRHQHHQPTSHPAQQQQHDANNYGQYQHTVTSDYNNSTNQYSATTTIIKRRHEAVDMYEDDIYDDGHHHHHDDDMVDNVHHASEIGATAIIDSTGDMIEECDDDEDDNVDEDEDDDDNIEHDVDSADDYGMAIAAPSLPPPALPTQQQHLLPPRATTIKRQKYHN